MESNYNVAKDYFCSVYHSLFGHNYLWRNGKDEKLFRALWYGCRENLEVWETKVDLLAEQFTKPKGKNNGRLFEVHDKDVFDLGTLSVLWNKLVPEKKVQKDYRSSFEKEGIKVD